MKILFGSVAVDGRGKLGGHVYSKNRAGSYVRTKVTPVNPQTSDQTGVRNNFTSISQAWRGLSDVQRAAWNGAVENFKTTNVFGSLKTPSGAQLYMRLNRNLHTAGQAAISTPPAPSSTTALTSISATADVSSNQFDVDFAPSPVPAGYTLVIQATAQVSPGITFLKNRFRVIATVAAAGTTPADIFTEYTTKFGALVAGNKVGVRGWLVHNTTGLKSLALSTEVIITA